MVKRLRRESAEFRELWERHEVARVLPGSKVKRFRNARVGLLHLDAARLWLGPELGTRMVAYTPADDETRERLEKLHAMVGEAR
jgi:hypothetical protein